MLPASGTQVLRKERLANIFGRGSAPLALHKGKTDDIKDSSLPYFSTVEKAYFAVSAGLSVSDKENKKNSKRGREWLPILTK